MAAVLAPVVLLSSPAMADAATGRGTIASASPSPTAKDYSHMSMDDLRIEVLTLMGKSPKGSSMRYYGDLALKEGTAEALVTFLQVTQYAAQEEDDRVAVLVILGKHPGVAVTEAANKALNGSAADVRHFLETGQYRAQEEDDRVAVLRLMAQHPSEKFRTAASHALDGGPAAVRRFLEVGQYRVR
ncbi:ALF repeat-containing protein [Streptomyces orinoci]|uniref:ALF repeat-containing protein n=1 Tax=Streptomyces orinoci TaxID=67339 RepID=A0ABV3K8G8_STRON|nr:ALF repeat-containing protein [Streptomyces orinoci]